jgi:hypothetical protein
MQLPTRNSTHQLAPSHCGIKTDILMLGCEEPIKDPREQWDCVPEERKLPAVCELVEKTHVSALTLVLWDCYIHIIGASFEESLDSSVHISPALSGSRAARDATVALQLFYL